MILIFTSLGNSQHIIKEEIQLIYILQRNNGEKIVIIN